MVTRDPASLDRLARQQEGLLGLLNANRRPPTPAPEAPAFAGEHATLDDVTRRLLAIEQVMGKLYDVMEAQSLITRFTNETYRGRAPDYANARELGPFARTASYVWLWVSDNDMTIQFSPDGSNWGNEMTIPSGDFHDLHVQCDRIRLWNTVATLTATYQIAVFRPNVVAHDTEEPAGEQ